MILRLYKWWLFASRLIATLLIVVLSSHLCLCKAPDVNDSLRAVFWMAAVKYEIRKGDSEFGTLLKLDVLNSTLERTPNITDRDIKVLMDKTAKIISDIEKKVYPLAQRFDIGYRALLEVPEIKMQSNLHKHFVTVWLQSEITHSSQIRNAAAYSFRHTDQFIRDYTNQVLAATFSACRETQSYEKKVLGFVKTIAVSPKADFQTLIDRGKTLFDNASVRPVVETLKANNFQKLDQQVLSNAIVSSFKSMRESIDSDIKVLMKMSSDNEVAKLVTGDLPSLIAQRTPEALRDLTLTSNEFLIGLGKMDLVPKEVKAIVNQLDTYANTLREVERSINQVVEFATHSENWLSSIGSAVLSGNIVGAMLNLGSIFGNSSNQQVLNEIKNLKSQIEDFRKSMDERFDRVDKRLDDLFKLMSDNFDKILQNQADFKAQLNAINIKLDGISNQIAVMEINVMNKLNDIERQNLERVIFEIVDYTTRSGSIDHGKFQNLSSAIRSEAVLSVNRAYTQHVSADGTVISEPPFESSIHDQINYLNDFATRGLPSGLSRKITDNASVPNVDKWVAAVKAYMTLAMRYPKDFESEPSSAIDAVIGVGSTFESAVNNIVLSKSGGNIIINRELFKELSLNYKQAMNKFIEALAEKKTNSVMAAHDPFVFTTNKTTINNPKFNVEGKSFDYPAGLPIPNYIILAEELNLGNVSNTASVSKEYHKREAHNEYYSCFCNTPLSSNQLMTFPYTIIWSTLIFDLQVVFTDNFGNRWNVIHRRASGDQYWDVIAGETRPDKCSCFPYEDRPVWKPLEYFEGSWSRSANLSQSFVQKAHGLTGENHGEVATLVRKHLKYKQTEYYKALIDPGDAALTNSLKDLTVAKNLISRFLEFGLREHLEVNDTLRAALYGESGLVDRDLFHLLVNDLISKKEASDDSDNIEANFNEILNTRFDNYNEQLEKTFKYYEGGGRINDLRFRYPLLTALRSFRP